MKKTNLIWMIGIIFIISLSYANAAEGGGGGGSCTCPSQPDPCINPNICITPPQCRASPGICDSYFSNTLTTCQGNPWCSGYVFDGCTYNADPEQNGFTCDDGLYCTVNDVCSSGNCISTARNCGSNSYCDENTDSCKCNLGFTKCGTSCVNLQTDKNNCGSCGNICSSSYNCVSGSCVYNAGCGNGIIDYDQGEECDGTNINGASCSDVGLNQGNVGCNLCKLDYSACYSSCGDGECELGESKYNCLADCTISGWTTINSGWKLTQNKQLNGTLPNIVLSSTNLNLKKGKTYKISASIFNPTDCNAYLEFDGLKIYSETNSNDFNIVENTKILSSPTQLNIKIDSCSNQSLQSQGILFDNVAVIEINESLDIPTVFDTYDFTQQGCCPANWCWNGTACVDSSLWEQTDYPAAFTTGFTSGYRCIAGNWIYSEVKWNWDHTDAQFCPSNNHCFVSASQGCVETGSYIEDHYCWNGAWSSRTKFMAMQLLQFAKDNSYSEYSVQCDNYELALNDYAVEQQYFLVGGATSNLLVNNFCVLKYREDNKEKVIIGTSFNGGFTIQNFLKNITNTAENYCDGVANNGNFNACSPINGKSPIWYNADKKVVLYGKEPFTLNPPEDWMTRFLSWLGTTFGFVHTDFLNLDLTMNVTDFNKIYVSRLYSGCDKSIFAVQELKSNQQTYHLQYHNFVADICSEINSKYQGTFICTIYNNGKSGINQIIKPYGAITLNDNLWQDLTSKLRIKEGACPKITSEQSVQ